MISAGNGEEIFGNAESQVWGIGTEPVRSDVEGHERLRQNQYRYQRLRGHRGLLV